MQLSAVADLFRAPDPARLFHALGDALSRQIPLRLALCVDVDDRNVREAWPGPAEIGHDFLGMIIHVPSAEVFKIGRDLPAEADRFPGAEALVLPMRADGGGPRSAAVLIADEGSFGEHLEEWEVLGEVFAAMESLLGDLREQEEECDALRRNVEESEALHTLGLGVNRSLDPDAVFPVVARLARTLLAAHYVVVHTRWNGGDIRPVASLGLRNPGAFAEGDPLLPEVMGPGHPVVLSGNDDDGPAGWEQHAAEDARTVVVAPLVIFGETVGALVAGYRRAHRFSDRDVRLLTALAGHAAVGISNASLHRELGERTTELESAYAELRRLSRMKERFFASINHELRTPLSAIMGYNTLILDGTAGEIPPQAQRYVKNSHRAAENLLTLVNDILDLSKLTAGKMSLAPSPLTVSEAVEELLDTVRPLASEKGLQIEVTLAEDLPPLETDPNRLRQILVNLASNAIKFTSAGSVRVEAGRVEGDGDVVELRVCDTGVGIPEDQLERIFEEFEQVASADAHRGTGLGLPISRQLARLMGGDLWAESEAGCGSTFVLRIPARLPDQESGGEAEEAATAAENGGGP